LDFTKPVQCKNGRKVEITNACDHVLFCGTPMPIEGSLDGSQFLQSWSIDGEYIPGEPTSFDLVNVPEPKTFRKEFWVNVYDLNNPIPSPWHFTKQSADYRIGQRKACVKVVVEGKEGDGL